MTIYELSNNKSFSYNHKYGIIRIGMHTDNDLSEKMVIKHTIDALTHETLHDVIYKTEGLTACSLFDIIGHKFRLYPSWILRIIASYNGNRTWDEVIEQDGYKHIIKTYFFNGLIDKQDLDNYGIKMEE